MKLIIHSHRGGKFECERTLNSPELEEKGPKLVKYTVGLVKHAFLLFRSCKLNFHARLLESNDVDL